MRRRVGRGFWSHDYAVKIVERWTGADPLPDAMVALHARRSAESIQQFRRFATAGRLLLALTGTDVYRDIHDDDDAAAVARAG